MLLRRRRPTPPSVSDLALEERWAMAESAPDEAPWFARVNVGLHAIAGHPEFRQVISVRAPMQGTDAAGLPDAEELAALADLEERLIDALTAERRTLPAAVLTRDGARSFVFYTRDAEDAIARIKALREELPGRRLEGNLMEDPEWSVSGKLIAMIVAFQQQAG